MSFCIECGFALNAEALQGNFCPECGSRIEKEDFNSSIRGSQMAPPIPPIPIASKSTSSPIPSKPKLPPVPGMPNQKPVEIDAEEKRREIFDRGYNSYGIIFTDTRKIAKTCRSTSNEIFNIIKNYTQRLKSYGHQYIIHDIDSTRLKDDDWTGYVESLTDFYNKQSIVPEYLFIIGGTEIIPMPVIDNLAGVETMAFDYETDIPYSYLKSYEVEEMIWDGSLYYEDLKLHVGRLPFGNDFQKEQIGNYFDKIITALDSNFKIDNCFSLSAEGWREASTCVLDNLAISKKYIDFSPSVTVDDVDGIFDATSNLLYFNLHGSNEPEQPGYFGDFDEAISPDQISRLIKNNVIITEACFGAKFIGYNTSDTMLLNSIHQNTLVFIGSSRVAFGASTSFISHADVIAHSVLGSLNENISVGEALSKARIENIDNINDGDYCGSQIALATAIMFNLFGDPIIKNSIPVRASKAKKKLTSSKNLSKIPPAQEIFNKNAQQSVLDQVRMAVDLEFDKIHRLIQKELYDQYGLTTQELNSVLYQESNTDQEYLYVYSKKQLKQTNNKLYYINCSKNGSIKKVLTSK